MHNSPNRSDSLLLLKRVTLEWKKFEPAGKNMNNRRADTMSTTTMTSTWTRITKTDGSTASKKALCSVIYIDILAVLASFCLFLVCMQPILQSNTFKWVHFLVSFCLTFQRARAQCGWLLYCCCWQIEQSNILPFLNHCKMKWTIIWETVAFLFVLTKAIDSNWKWC